MSETFEPDTGEMIVKRVSVPIGLEELMEGLAKEVLLKKPDDIYLFAADYFARLLLLREKGSYKARPFRCAQSIAKQTPKQPIDKLLVRGASKQLSRQISIRGESPTKRVAPIKRLPPRTEKDDRSTERNKVMERRRARKAESTETKNTETRKKQVATTPKPSPENNDDKSNDTNRRDRSLSNSRRGRSTSRNIQNTSRQTSTSTPRQTDTPSEKTNKSSARGEDKQKLAKSDNKKDKSEVGHVPSIEESQEFVKEGKLTVIPPQTTKRPPVTENNETISSLIKPQVDHLTPLTVKDNDNLKEQVQEKVTIDKQEKESPFKNDSDKTDDIEDSGIEIKDNDATKERGTSESKSNDNQHNQIFESTKNCTDHSKKEDKDGVSESKPDSLMIGKSLDENSSSEEIDSSLKRIQSSDKHETSSSSSAESKSSTYLIKENRKTPVSTEKNNLDELKRSVSETKKDITKNSSELTKHSDIINLSNPIANKVIATPPLEVSKDENNSSVSHVRDVKAEDLNKPDHSISEPGEVDYKDKHTSESNNKHHKDKSDEAQENNISESTQLTIDPIKTKTEKSSDGSNVTNVYEKLTTVEPISSKQDSIKNGDNICEIEGSVKDKCDSKTDGKLSEGNKRIISEGDKSLHSFSSTTADENNKVTDVNIPSVDIIKSEKNVNSATSQTKGEKEQDLAIKKEYPNQESNNENDKPITDIGTNNLNKNDETNKRNEIKTEKSVKGNVLETDKESKGVPSIDELKDTITNSEKNVTETKVDIDKNVSKESENIEKGKLHNENDSVEQDQKSHSLDSNITNNGEKDINNVKESSIGLKSDLHKNVAAPNIGKISPSEKVDKQSKENKMKSNDILEIDKEKPENDKQVIDKPEGIKKDIKNDTEPKRKQKENIKSQEQLKINATPPVEGSNDKGKMNVNDGYIDKSLKKEPSHEKENEKNTIIKNKETVLTQSSTTENEKAGDLKQINEDKTSLQVEEKTEKSKNKESSNNSVMVTDVPNKIESLESQNMKDMKKKEMNTTLFPNANDIKEYNDIDSSTVISDATDIKKCDKEGESKDGVKETSQIEKKVEVENRNREQGNSIVLKNEDTLTSHQAKNEKNQIVQQSDTQEFINQKDEPLKHETAVRNNNFSSDENNKSEENSKQVQDTIRDTDEKLVTNSKSAATALASPLIPGDIKQKKHDFKDDIESTGLSKSNQTAIENVNIVQKNDDHLKLGQSNNQQQDSEYFKETNLNQGEKETNADTEKILKKNSSEDESSVQNSDKGGAVEPESHRNQSSDVSLDEKKQSGMLNNVFDEKDKMRETDENKLETVLEGKESRSTISSNDTKIPISSSISTDKEFQDISSTETNEISENEIGANTKEVKSVPGIEPEISRADLKENFSPSQDSKEKNLDPETNIDNKSLAKTESKEFSLGHSQNDIINSVIDIANGGLVDHKAKSCIGDFIQNEARHVFIEKSDLNDKTQRKDTAGAVSKLDTENHELEATIIEKHINTNDDPKIKKPDQDLTQNNETYKKPGDGDIINSVINIVKDNILNHRVKSYLNNFIHGEKQHVFIEKSHDGKFSNPMVQQSLEKGQEDSVSSSKHAETAESANVNPTFLLQTEQKVDVSREDIDNFLHNEKENIFRQGNISEDIDKAVEKEIVPNNALDLKAAKDRSTSKDGNKISNRVKENILDTSMSKNKMDVKNDHTNSTVNVNEEKQMGKNKDDRKMRRVRTVDVIRDESNKKTHIKSRIPTADYRNRVKREEDSKHSIRIKRSRSQNDNLKLPLKPLSAVKKKDEGGMITNDVAESKNVKEKVPDKDDEVTDYLPDKNNDADMIQKVIDISNNSQSQEESKEIENKVKKIESSLVNQPMESKQQFQENAINDAKHNISLNDIASVIKIQSLWRGLKVRKSVNYVKGQQILGGKVNNAKVISQDLKEALVSNSKQVGHETVVDTEKKHNVVIKRIEEDESKMENAATVIQKNWRGFEARKQLINTNIKETSDKPNINKDQKIELQMNDKDASVNKDAKFKPVASDEEKFVKAAMIIQKLWRGFKVRKITLPTNSFNNKPTENNKKSENLTQKEDASITNFSQDFNNERFKAAAVIIQKIWRGFKIRNKSKSGTSINSESRESKSESNLDLKPETKKQDINIKVVNEISELKLSEPLDETSEEKLVKAATLIQKIWRGFQVRKLSKGENNHSKKEILHKNVSVAEHKTDPREEVAEVVTKKVSTSNSTEIKLPLKSEAEFMKAAILIQKIWRGFNTRRFLRKTKKTDLGVTIKDKEIKTPIKEVNNQEEFIKAAILIQKIWRGFKIRNSSSKVPLPEKIEQKNITIETDKGAKSNQVKMLQNDEKFVQAAILIQKIWRGFNGRKTLKRPSNAKIDTQPLRTEPQNKKTPVKEAATNENHQKSKKNEEELLKAVILIQKIWRGFNVRQNLSKENTNKAAKIKVDEQNQSAGKSQIQSFTISDDKLFNAAILIQKIWRGFKVRKVTEGKKNLPPKKIETKKPEPDIVKDVDVRSKKSATKIQSLWRGYQVRKNINVIKNKLEENNAINVAGTGKELTDGDILNAATKIQAGVRGFLQRKKYKTEIKPEKQINLLTQNASANEHDFDIVNRKLSEEEVLKALNDLNKLDIPNDILRSPKTDKPEFYRSNTVHESEIIKKHSPLLLKSMSLEHTKGKADNLLETTPAKDDINNNNNTNEHKDLTPLERETKEAIHNIIRNTDNNEENTLNDKNNEKTNTTDSGNKQTFEDFSTGKDRIEQDTVIESEFVPEKDKFNSTTSTHISENKDVATKLEPCNESTNLNEKPDHNEPLKDTGKNMKVPVVSYNVNKEDDIKEPLSDKEVVKEDIKDDQDDEAEKHTYDRPLSMDSNDSAVTVIYKGEPISSNKKNLKSDEFEAENYTTEPFVEHESLINDFQNKILNQISGGNDSTQDDVPNKFDIERLRKELEDAGLIHSHDDDISIRHQNSREIVDDHDELRDYLGHFEFSTEKATQSSYLDEPEHNLATRDLPDIKEEDMETKSAEDTETNHRSEQNKEIPKHESIEKIKFTLKECEDIAREINMGFETAKSEQSFCGTREKSAERNVVPNDVELIKSDIHEMQALHANNISNIGNNETLETESTAEESTSHSIPEKSVNGLLHTGELHDLVNAPLTNELELGDLQNIDRKNAELSPQKSSEFLQSNLLHTGELHDAIVVPLPLSVRNSLKIDKEKSPNSIPLAVKEEPLSKSKSNDTNSNLTVNSKVSSITGFLHTGELHDSLVVPLPIATREALLNSSHKPVEDDVKKSVPKDMDSEDLVHSTGLLHTGELHDSVVVPVPDLARDEPGKNSEDGQSNKSDTGTANTPRQVDSECQTNADPAIAVHLNEVPAGVAALTSPRSFPAVRDVSGVVGRSTQAPDKGALPKAPTSDISPPSHLQGMESEKRSNQATVNNKSMEVQAATKIQAGFRGYQVRKQLKLKNGSSDINNQRRQLRRKSSGRLTEANRTAQNKSKETNEVEKEKEKSAVKIQAGVRGFLVRRRQKKQKNQES